MLSPVAAGGANNKPSETSLREAELDKSSDVEYKKTKIVARLTPDDELRPYVHRRAISADQTSPLKSKLPRKSVLSNKAHIDTTAPFESVKAAVSMFGEIVDWKAHRMQTAERCKFLEIEAERAHEEMPTYKQQCEAVEEAKAHVLNDLENTKRVIEELKFNLERAQKEEHQAKLEAEQAALKVEEMEKGEGISFSAKAQIEVAKARHTAAASELRTVNEKLQHLRKDYDLLMAEKDAAGRKVEEAVFTSKEAEQSVEDLKIELVTLKQFMESSRRLSNNVNWEEDLNHAKEELEKLNNKMLSTKVLKSNLKEATALLQDLKDELVVYMEMKHKHNGNDNTSGDIKAAIISAGKELLDVKIRIMKANQEVTSARMESATLRSDLKEEKKVFERIQHREDMASNKLKSLEVELKAVESRIIKIEQAKALVEKACRDLLKAEQESEQAKVSKFNKENELKAAQKEIETSKAYKKLALATISALEKSESESDHKENDGENSPTTGIKLSLVEYFELSKKAYNAEEQGKARVTSAMSEIEEAKESEVRSLNKLEEVSREISDRKDELKTAQLKAAHEVERKLVVEQELRNQKRKKLASVNTSHEGNHYNFCVWMPKSSCLKQRASPRKLAANGEKEKAVTTDLKAAKKKKSFFPKFFWFMGRKKTQRPKKD